MELELMLSLVGDVTGERIAEILGEELTGSLIEKQCGRFKREGGNVAAKDGSVEGRGESTSPKGSRGCGAVSSGARSGVCR